MTPRQTLLIVFTGLFFLAIVVLLSREQRLRERYAILWIGTGMLFLSMPLLHDFYIEISAMLGIVNPISFFFFLAIIALFLLCLQFTLALSIAFVQRRECLQRLALLERRVKELEKLLTNRV